MVVPESGIQVTSHLRFLIPNPQSLIPSYSFLLSNFRDDDTGKCIFNIRGSQPRLATLDSPFQRKGRECGVAFQSPATSNSSFLISSPI